MDSLKDFLDKKLEFLIELLSSHLISKNIAVNLNDAKEKLLEYLKFIISSITFLENNNQNIFLPLEISLIWRTHFLFTEQYKEFIKEIIMKFGSKLEFFNFNANLTTKLALEKVKKNELNTFYIKTQENIGILFKNSINKDIWKDFSLVILSYNEYINYNIFQTEINIKQKVIKIEENINKSYLQELSENSNINEKIDFIEKFNFPEEMCFLIAKELLFSEEIVEILLNEYKQFLILIYLNSICVKDNLQKTYIAPNNLIDEIWHIHMLFWNNYKDFCKNLGILIKHLPNSNQSSDSDVDYNYTVKFYKQCFKKINESFWENEKNIYFIWSKNSKNYIEM